MKIPQVHKLSRASQFSLLAIVILLGAVFFTVNSALQEQNSAGHASGGTNILLNPSFESGTASWNLYTQAPALGAFTITSSTHEDGAYAAQVTVLSPSTTAWQVQLREPNLPMQAGQTYTVTFWAKASSSRQIDSLVQNYLSPYQVYKEISPTITTSWQQYSYTFTAPETQSNVFVGFNFAQAIGVVWIDNVSYTSGGSAPTSTSVFQQSSAQSIANFVLWNASSQQQLLTMTNGMTLNLATLPTCLDISATTSPGTVGSVNFDYDSTANFEEANGPIYWFEDTDLANTPICYNYTIGTHTITATPYTQANESGTAGQPQSITFNVINSLPTPTLRPTPVPTAIPTRTPTVIPTSVPTAIPIPTDTPIPGSTVIAINVGLHGIGLGGDSANPGSQGNMSPLHPTRTIRADIYDTQNQLVMSQQGTVNFDGSSGRFKGTVDLGNGFTTGLYTVKVKTDQYLRGLVPGIQSISAGQTNTLPAVILVAGDINGDNAINIVDYNILIGCYSDLLPATDCTATNNGLADITDDGHVNQFDYNLFLRELTNIGGQ